MLQLSRQCDVDCYHFTQVISRHSFQCWSSKVELELGEIQYLVGIINRWALSKHQDLLCMTG